jgi:hypothetical protein
MSQVNVTGGAPEDNLQEVKDYVAGFDAQREKATPSWWTDWLKSVTQK